METVFLDLEEIDEFFRLFDDEEKGSTPIAIGQVNSRSPDGQTVTVDLMITTRVNYPENGDTIVRYSENVGIGLIPFEAMKEGGRREKEEYDERKKNMDLITKKINELKNSLILKFEGKGFPVVKGVWMA